MTISTRGLRKIVVDGHSYVWRARKTKCPCCRSRAVVIADASRRGSVVHLPGPDAFETKVSVTPAKIAASIRRAIGMGWRPGTGAGVFVRLPSVDEQTGT